ncbi:GNAT family N-acetyltransferase [Brenneria goodwinii]|uniref:GNAT family N-acetyltransferase n=1 Tax=Brenneria goodwinii TaxID=1109412 RepID=UPI0036F0FBE8
MIINNKEFQVNGLTYTIRPSIAADAQALSALRVQIDGETENLDRESGEGFIDESGFEQLIRADAASPVNLFLVAVVNRRIVGFSRCEGTNLKRLAHKIEFGVCVLKDFWGYGIGKNLLTASIAWADANGVKKMALSALETNIKAIELYKKLGFEVEGILKNDKLLADGKYYNTIVMGRWLSCRNFTPRT